MTKSEQAQLAELQKKLDDFIAQYNSDMRGDNDPNSKNIGMINEIRELKKYRPLQWYFLNYPVQFLTCLFFGFAAMDFITTFGIFTWIAARFGWWYPKPPTP